MSSRLFDLISRAHAQPYANVLAAARADLGCFLRAIEDAIANDVLPGQSWVTFRDHRIARVLKSLPASTSIERSAASKAGRDIRPYIRAHLTSTAA